MAAGTEAEAATAAGAMMAAVGAMTAVQSALALSQSLAVYAEEMGITMEVRPVGAGLGEPVVLRLLKMVETATPEVIPGLGLEGIAIAGVAWERLVCRFGKFPNHLSTCGYMINL